MTSPDAIRDEVLDDLRCNRLQLPTLPEVALHIRDEVQKDNVSLESIAKIVTTDPAICTKILQVVNSPLYRRDDPISNIKSAITRLGFQQIKNLVCSLVLKQMYQSTNRNVNKLLHQCWNHSARVAAIAAVLTRGIKGLNSDQAILAGLIHDIGKLPLIVHAEKIPELIEDESAMRVLFFSLHADVGSHVLQKWNFPEELVEVAKHHDNIGYSHNNAGNYTDIIIIANLFSYYGRKHFIAETEWDTIHAFERLGIAPTGDYIENTDNISAITEIELILTS